MAGPMEVMIGGGIQGFSLGSASRAVFAVASWLLLWQSCSGWMGELSGPSPTNHASRARKRWKELCAQFFNPFSASMADGLSYGGSG